MIRYYRLFDLLNRKEMKKTDLLQVISSPTLAKLSKGESLNINVIDKICFFLRCQPGDIMEWYDEETEKNKKKSETGKKKAETSRRKPADREAGRRSKRSAARNPSSEAPVAEKEKSSAAAGGKTAGDVPPAGPDKNEYAELFDEKYKELAKEMFNAGKKKE